MLGVNVPVPAPVGHHNFGGLRRSKFGDAHMFGPRRRAFYTKIKTVRSAGRRPDEGLSRCPARSRSTFRAIIDGLGVDGSSPRRPTCESRHRTM